MGGRVSLALLIALTVFAHGLASEQAQGSLSIQRELLANARQDFGSESSSRDEASSASGASSEPNGAGSDAFSVSEISTAPTPATSQPVEFIRPVNPTAASNKESESNSHSTATIIYGAGGGVVFVVIVIAVVAVLSRQKRERRESRTIDLSEMFLAHPGGNNTTSSNGNGNGIGERPYAVSLVHTQSPVSSMSPDFPEAGRSQYTSAIVPSFPRQSHRGSLPLPVTSSRGMSSGASLAPLSFRTSLPAQQQRMASTSAPQPRVSAPNAWNDMRF